LYILQAQTEIDRYCGVFHGGSFRVWDFGQKETPQRIATGLEIYLWTITVMSKFISLPQDCSRIPSQ
jgi:hypothetical protein